MNKEILYVLIYFDAKLNKIQWKCLSHIEDYEILDNDLFFFVREEIFFNQENIDDFFDYYEITNSEEIRELELKNVFYTTEVVDCNLHSYEFKDEDIKNEILNFYNDFIKDITPQPFDKFLDSFSSEK